MASGPLPLRGGAVQDAATQQNLEGIAQAFPLQAQHYADGSVIDAKIASPNNPAYKTVLGPVGLMTYSAFALTGTVPLGIHNVNISPVATSAEWSTADVNFGAHSLHFVAADYAVAGLTTKLRVRAIYGCNGTAPAATLTTSLKLMAPFGGAGSFSVTAGAAITGSSVAITSPSANVWTTAETSDFDVPSDGVYMLCVTLNQAVAANNRGYLSAVLQVRNV